MRAGKLIPALIFSFLCPCVKNCNAIIKEECLADVKKFYCINQRKGDGWKFCFYKSFAWYYVENNYKMAVDIFIWCVIIHLPKQNICSCCFWGLNRRNWAVFCRHKRKQVKVRRLPHKSHQTAEPTVSRFVRKNERSLSDYERK